MTTGFTGNQGVRAEIHDLRMRRSGAN
jgi:hypothetical protein